MHTQDIAKQELVQKIQLDYSAYSQKSVQDIEEFMKVQNKLIERQVEIGDLIKKANQQLVCWQAALPITYFIL